VPWGQQAVLDRRSMRPVTLIEALGVLAVLDVLAVVGVLWCRRAGPPFDSPTPTR